MRLVSPYLDQKRYSVRSRSESSRTPEFLVPLLTASQKREYLTLVIIWLAALVAFWIWWLQPEHNIGWFGFVLSTLVLAWVTLIPLYFTLIVFRGRIPSSISAIPSRWRVAMVVTKVPSEPFALVRQTLQAMLRQRYPHDTWLADENPSAETIEWCREHGVRISTRKGCAAYHQPDWPRRTRCKEGNLAYFYDHYGYANYDFVVQLDADHVPSQGYLEEMLRPFADSTVGYVSAPSICDRNAHESWSARGRLYVEGALHAALQAGYNGGFAPLCIGSHYAVRTAALKQIGGLGPELAEDHSTTLLMNVHGWRGVHAINAIAHGDGPQNFTDMVTQEFQWSRSLMMILLEHTPKYFSSLTPRLKFQFLFSQLWYASYSTMMLLMFALPLVALFRDQPLVNVAYPHFLAYSLPLAVILMAIVGRLRAFGLLRPQATKIFSWEGVLFLFARWPWTLLGTLAALRARITRTVSDFRVTPKGADAAAQLPMRVLVPYATLSIVSGLAVLLLDSEAAPGYYIFALLNCLIYTGLLLIILTQHERENKSLVMRAPHRFLLSCSRMALIGAVLIPMLGTTRVPAGVSGLLWTGDSAKSPALEMTGSVGSLPQPGRLVFGIYDPVDSIGGTDAIGIDHIFVHWNVFNRQILSDASRRASSRNRILMVTVEPFTYALNWRDGGEELLSKITAGDYDDSIEDVCGSLGKAGAPVLLRWGHEMDDRSGRYPWARNDPDGYIKAFRHFVHECRIHAPTAKFVWSPKGKRHVEQFYPGDD